MACFHPIDGYRGVDGTVKFSRPGAYVDKPVTISCGQCSGCRLEKSRQWAARCLNEAQMHPYNSFITLTYDNENLPADNSIDVKHWQNFAKKLRNKAGPFRFLHCGEYGDKKDRPHYHALLFGLDFHRDRTYLKSTTLGDKLYVSGLLNDCWGKGYANIGSLTYASAAYTARYAMKKQTGLRAQRRYGGYYEYVDTTTGEVHPVELRRKPEYVTMSLNPGIGSTWFEKFHSDVYPRDEQIINGTICRPPAYYDKLYERMNPKGMATIKSQRRYQASKHEENNTPERLRVRESIQELKADRLIRDLEYH